LGRQRSPPRRRRGGEAEGGGHRGGARGGSGREKERKRRLLFWGGGSSGVRVALRFSFCCFYRSVRVRFSADLPPPTPQSQFSSSRRVCRAPVPSPVAVATNCSRRRARPPYLSHEPMTRTTAITPNSAYKYN
jgi:hypothetical protein